MLLSAANMKHCIALNPFDFVSPHNDTAWETCLRFIRYWGFNGGSVAPPGLKDEYSGPASTFSGFLILAVCQSETQRVA